MSHRTLQTSFNSGEQTPLMGGRVDHKKYQAGARSLLNMIPRSQGPLYRRMGTEFLGMKKHADKFSLSITRQPTLEDIYQIETGDYYLRIWKDGVLVTQSSPSIPGDVYSITTPWTAEEAKTLFYSSTVDILRFYHKSGTKQLRRVSVSPGSEEWVLTDYLYSDGPYNPEDNDAGVVMTLSDPAYIVKLTKTGAFSSAVVGQYVEYKKKNQWYLGRVLGVSSTPAAPANPSANECYIEPVPSIVRNIDQSAVLYVSSTEVRSTVRVFNYGLKGSWLRLADTKAGSATKWAKITDYLGLKDYPQVTLTNPTISDLTVAHTYKLTARTSGTITVGGGSAYQPTTVGESFTLGTGYTVSSPILTLDDLTTLKQYDVVQVDTPVTFISAGENVIEDTYKNEVSVATSSDLFSSPRDIGRFIRVKLGAKHISMKITAIADGAHVTAKLLNNLPYKDNSNEILDNGQTVNFRFGSFYKDNHPICGIMHEKRHVVAGAPDYPEGIHFSVLGNEFSFLPSDEDGKVSSVSAFTAEAESETLSTVRWLITAVNLVVGTESSEHLLRTLSNSQPITSENAKITKESSSGSLMRPLLTETMLLFVQRSGLALNQMQYSADSAALDVTRANKEAEHILRQGGGVVSFALQQYPEPMLWFSLRDGTIATLTYDQKENVLAWSRSKLGGGGLVEWVSVAASSDGKEDHVYLDTYYPSSTPGAGYRAYERLASQHYPIGVEDKEGMVYLDNYTKFGAGLTVLSGLSRFNGREVGVVVDGTELKPRTVVGGQITLDTPTVGYVYVGYRTKALLKPIIPFVTMKSGNVSTGALQKIKGLVVYVQDSYAMKVGLTEETASDVTFSNTSDNAGSSGPLRTSFMDWKATADMRTTRDPSVIIFTDSAYPLNIMSLEMDIETETQ